jgi:hypothetical protein
MVLFSEFCDWAIKKNLDLEDDDNDDSNDVVEKDYYSPVKKGTLTNSP